MATQGIIRSKSSNTDVSDASSLNCSEIKLETDYEGGENQALECPSIHNKITQTQTRNAQSVDEQVKLEQESAESNQILDYQAAKYIENNGLDLMAGIKQEVNDQAAWCVKTEVSEICENQKLDCEVAGGASSTEWYSDVAPQDVGWDRKCLVGEKTKHPGFFEGNEKRAKEQEADVKSENVIEYVKHDASSEITQGNEHSIKKEIENKTGDLCCTTAVRSDNCITEHRTNDGGEPVNVMYHQAADVDVNVNWDRNKVALCNVDGESSSENTLSCSRQGIQHSMKKSDVFDVLRCDKKFTVQKHLICKFCDVRFTESALLHMHLLKTHNRAFTQLILNKITQTDEKHFRCDVCDKAFSRTSELKIHKRMHTGEKPYKCEVCDRAFSRSSVLKTHKKIHSGEKPYKCDVCDGSFFHSFDLKRHMRMHTGEKPYKCDVCNGSFSHSFDLKMHKRIHTGEKPYKCDVCGVRFAQSGTLNRHRRVHS